LWSRGVIKTRFSRVKVDKEEEQQDEEEDEKDSPRIVVVKSCRAGFCSPSSFFDEGASNPGKILNIFPREKIRKSG